MRLGLLGFPLGHSFSRGWFEERGFEFRNFEFGDCGVFVEEVRGGRFEGLRGFGVTIPHKRAVMEYLDVVDGVAGEIGAVNCVVVEGGEGGAQKMRLVGYNTDAEGFLQDFVPLFNPAEHKSVAVLGSGGASRAVVWAFKKLGIPKVEVISRSNGGYETLKPSDYQVIINTTPLGMFPDVDFTPPIDYSQIQENTICYDLVYNPPMTKFLHLCKQQRAVVKGGIGMLTAQAEAALRHYAAPL